MNRNHRAARIVPGEAAPKAVVMMSRVMVLRGVDSAAHGEKVAARVVRATTNLTATDLVAATTETTPLARDALEATADRRKGTPLIVPGPVAEVKETKDPMVSRDLGATLVGGLVAPGASARRIEAVAPTPRPIKNDPPKRNHPKTDRDMSLPKDLEDRDAVKDATSVAAVMNSIDPVLARAGMLIITMTSPQMRTIGETSDLNETVAVIAVPPAIVAMVITVRGIQAPSSVHIIGDPIRGKISPDITADRTSNGHDATGRIPAISKRFNVNASNMVHGT